MARTSTKPDRGAVLRRRNGGTASAGPAPSPLADLDAAVASAANSLGRLLPISSIIPMDGQPRTDFADDALEELADSIRERGVLQPIRVKPLDGERWQLIAGERRWRAAERAGLDEIPAFICAPGDSTDEFADALVENLLRENLNDLEIARGLQLLIDDWGVSQSEAARRLGLSKTKASRLLNTLRLPAAIQKNVASGLLHSSHVAVLLGEGLTDEQRVELAWQAIEDRIPIRRFEHQVKAVRAANAGETLVPEDGGEGKAKPRRQASEPIPADRLEYARRWADAVSQATNLDVSVTAMRGPGYQIRVSTHQALIELGEGLESKRSKREITPLRGPALRAPLCGPFGPRWGAFVERAD